jgi:hypothetical protein
MLVLVWSFLIVGIFVVLIDWAILDLVLELIEGGDLLDYILKNNGLSELVSTKWRTLANRTIQLRLLPGT